jgi:hypothetical protein
MARLRLLVVAFVVLGLVVPATDGHAQVRDTESACGNSATFVLRGTDEGITGFDDDDPIAEYNLTATWCLERTFETTSSTETVSQSPSDGTTLSADTDDPKQLKRKKGRKAKRARRNRRRNTREPDDGTRPEQRNRTERRLVSTCMTNFQLAPTPRGVDGVEFLSATTAEIGGGDPCVARTFRVEGRFGRDYIADVPGFTRSVIRQRVSGATLENYPAGRVGYFNFTVQFNRDSRAGTCMSAGCHTPFEFCDVRIITGDDDTCVRL